jgi:hypothetical protein
MIDEHQERDADSVQIFESGENLNYIRIMKDSKSED